MKTLPLLPSIMIVCISGTCQDPKDKALVENAVKLMYKSVYTDLEGLMFHDLKSLNASIIQSLNRFNERKLTGRNQSRRQLFEEVEKDYLRLYLLCGIR